MLNKKQIVTAGATLGIALATGFVMQNGDAVASRFGEQPEAQPPVQPQDQAQSEVPQEEATPAEPVLVEQASVLPQLPELSDDEKLVEVAAIVPETEPNLVIEASVDAGPEIEEIETIETPVEVLPTPQPEAEPEMACETTMEAKAGAAAMVALELNSSCHPNERVTIHHEGMMFTGETDATGVFSVDVPALSENAIFIAAFANNEGAMSQIDVPSVEFYDRVVLQWRGENALQLHAREFGADYGEEGHVWSDDARDASVAATGQGGFMTMLGSGTDDTALLAEVYSFPTGFITDSGRIDMSVEAEVTAENCARDIEAQSIQIGPGAETAVSDLVLSVPDCDAIGDFLVLTSMVDDLTLVSN